jgi:hypothetical protein
MLAGELVAESGTAGGEDLEGRGGPLGLTCTFEKKGEHYAQLEHLHFTGDDPETPANEAYLPWNHRWTGWSKWCVGGLLADLREPNRVRRCRGFRGLMRS